MALLDPSGRARSDVRVKGFCEGYHLSREKFEHLQTQYPFFRTYIENVARLRLQRMSAENGAKVSNAEESGAELNAVQRRLAKKSLGRRASQQTGTTPRGDGPTPRGSHHGNHKISSVPVVSGPPVQLNV
jgi:hypothetical protein